MIVAKHLEKEECHSLEKLSFYDCEYRTMWY